MWWIIGSIGVVAGVCAAVISRRGGSMDRTDIDGHGMGAAHAISTRNDGGGTAGS
ncbi:hypothetical protein [Janibacter indicus]|uniref:hypothetical protein n=1 Tax=Janibacter indicus TaxID=857417 RepID=UPI003EBD2C07